MKNKTLTYVLLAVVGIIWYQVFFRVKGSLFGEEEAVPPTVNVASVVPNVERDTFKLNANYRDPFGETKVPIAIPVENARPPVVRNNPRPKRIETQWPPIQYFGMIRKTESRNPLAILKVDGIQLMLREGEEMFNEITLKRIERDSILVMYKREKKVFKRN